MNIPDVLVPFMDGVTFLPFVRDSKLAPTISVNPTTVAPAKKPETVETTDPLSLAIAAKGEELRVLKAAKVSYYSCLVFYLRHF